MIHLLYCSGVPRPTIGDKQSELRRWLAAQGHGAHLGAVAAAMEQAQVPGEEMISLLCGMDKGELAQFVASCAQAAASTKPDPEPEPEPEPDSEPEPKQQVLLTLVSTRTPSCCSISSLVPPGSYSGTRSRN